MMDVLELTTPLNALHCFSIMGGVKWKKFGIYETLDSEYH